MALLPIKHLFFLYRAVLLCACCVAFGGTATLCLAAGLTLMPLKPHFPLGVLVAVDAACVLGGSGLNFILVLVLADSSEPTATVKS